MKLTFDPPVHQAASLNTAQPASTPRIVSLISSATEIVCALGLEDQLVGISHECDFPPGIRQRPVCSRPRINVETSSGEIDRQVRNSLAQAMSIYEVYGPEIRDLQPTHLITQSQCQVCAVSLQDVEREVCHLVGAEVEVISLEPMNLEDVLNDVINVAQSCGVLERGAELVQNLRDRLNNVQTAVAGRERPTVVCLEWLDPLMSAGNWVPELVSIAGGIPLLCEAGRHSPWMTWGQLQQADPDVIVILPCGFDIARTLTERHLLTQWDGWQDLRAVRSGRVFVADGNQYFNRPGPRLVESAELLAEIFHSSCEPGACRDSGSGWVRF